MAKAFLCELCRRFHIGLPLKISKPNGVEYDVCMECLKDIIAKLEENNRRS